MAHAEWSILSDTPRVLTILDTGLWDTNMTVTNDAEWVVKRLLLSGLLKPGQRLAYVDSDGQTDEILIADGCFAGFAPWRDHA